MPEGAVKVAGQARRKLGRQTVAFAHPPRIGAVASIAGPTEGQGPLGGLFDEVCPDSLLGMKTWEQAESRLVEKAVGTVLTKAGLQQGDIDLLICGDLLNQLAASIFAGRGMDMPFLGVYAACACWTESLALAGVLLDGGYADRVAVAVSSHHLTAERQFRYPTEFGVQRPPTATWTATGAGAAVLHADGEGPRLTHATWGRLMDLGLKDPYDMGSAMAPAAADTIVQHMNDTGRGPGDYDLIITGDLGRVGKPIAADLIGQAGHDVSGVLDDCGIRLYDQAKQDVHAGGSGCACSALTFAADLFPDLLAGRLNRVLFVSTGAMFSTTTYQQGETIPAIAYAVAIERPEE